MKPGLAAQPQVAAPPKAAQDAPVVAAAAPASGSAAGQLADAKRLFRSGQVRKARETLLALPAGQRGEAVLELARTYDAFYLELSAKPDAAPDPKRALSLYEEARKLGNSSADVDLKRLLSKLISPRT